MTLEEALRTYLVNDTAVGALVGGRVSTQTMPQDGQLPAITFQRISTAPLNHRADGDFGQVRMQVDGWASNYQGTMALRTALRDAMKGFTRSAAPRVDGTRMHDARDLRDPETDRWRISMDFMIWTDEG